MLKIISVLETTVALTLLLTGDANAQNRNKYFLDGRMLYGFVVAHSPRIEHLVTGHTKGFQLNFGKQTAGEKEWNNIYNYPQTGISLVNLDFANPERLGSATGVLVFVDLPFIRNPNFMFSLNLGEGLGYVTKKFSMAENRKNLVTGSKLNAAIQIFIQTSYRLSPKTDFRLALGLTHFSNGSLTTPNIGINNASISSGLIFRFDTARTVPKKSLLPQVDGKIRYEVFVSGGVKEIYPPEGKKYFAWSLSGEAVKPLSHKYSLSAGADLFYDLSIDDNVKKESGILHNPPSNRTRSGIFISNEFAFNRLAIVLQLGVYLYYPFKDDGSAYHRLGFRYRCSDHLLINYTLKAHYARADNTEIGIGYLF
jgi:hypothetical protein